MIHPRYAITLAFAALLLSSSPALLAQGRSIPVSSEVKAEEQKELPDVLPEGQKYRYRFFNGLNVSVDILDPLLSRSISSTPCSTRSTSSMPPSKHR